jgi:multiple sugar transport system substrate-binding protein
MSKRITLLAVLALLVVLPFSVQAQEKTVVNWFVGLGTGGNPEQVTAQEQVVADFNASQDEIELVLTVVPFESGRDTLSTLIAADTSPDIVGPVGVGGSNAFEDQWADLTPYIEASGYDLSAFDPALVDLYRTPDGELLGIPFAVFPSTTLYNKDLFDEAGLNYPPAAYGDKYVMPDGTEVDWNYETLAEVAKILTVDSNGNDASMEEFDSSSVVQFGFIFQWAGLRLMWTDMQPEDIYDETANSIVIPESWRTASSWLQDAVWGSGFYPNQTYQDSEAFTGGGGAFSTGNVAMTVDPLWYTCCLGESVGSFEWDMGTVPMSFDGEYHVATDADTFRMTKGSPNPEAAFTALSYLLNEAVPTLAPVYGAFPARPEYQQAFIDSKAEQFPFVENWAVAAEGLSYNNPGNMHHEANFPNWQQGNDRIQAFSTLLFGETGGEIDIEAELDTLESDLNDIINQ